MAPQGLSDVLDVEDPESNPGCPSVSREIRDLIRRMSGENAGWGAPRIHGELLKLGIDIGETSVSKYLVRSRKPPSQTWGRFSTIISRA
jgi:putative transposase